MIIYATSKNSGPTISGPDPVYLLYLGTSLKEAEETVGDFAKYYKGTHPITRGSLDLYSAIPKQITRTFVGWYAADGWWYTIVQFELKD